jgi:uncharacterized membrane protein HdeD (DUF308 family)
VNTKSIIHVGIALILLGIVAFTYQGNSDTGGENAVNIKPVLARVDIKKPNSISPVLGAIALVGGIVLVVVGIKKSP